MSKDEITNNLKIRSFELSDIILYGSQLECTDVPILLENLKEDINKNKDILDPLDVEYLLDDVDYLNEKYQERLEEFSII